MRDFWISSGHHLLDRDANGGLVVTDDFLKIYLARPELMPPSDACDAERILHDRLLNEPRRSVSSAEFAAIADPDARENWQLFVSYRDFLLRHKTLEAAYLDLMRNSGSRVPPLFINQLVHVILRNALDGCEDAEVLRAAELFFRAQRVTVLDKSLIAADEETIGGIGGTPSSPLVSMLGIPAEAHIHVLNADNADEYWERSDQFDTAINLTGGQSGSRALAATMTKWIEHLLGVEVDIEPLIEVRDVNLVWYVGLDADATRIGDTMWNGGELDEKEAGRIAGLFSLTFRDPALVLDEVKGEPVYLILAMTPGKLIRMKPQNLVAGLPIKHLEAVG